MFSDQTVFAVETPKIDFSTGHVTLQYSIDNEPSFEEKYEFGETAASDKTDQFEAAIHLLAVAAATSYYKTVYGAKFEIHLAGGEALVEMAKALLGPGLAELRYTNGFAIGHCLNVEAVGPAIPADSPKSTASSKSGQRRSLTGLGGGKDSFVAAEILRKAGRQVTFCSVNPRSVMNDAATAFGAPLVSVKRTIDKRLIEANSRGAINGHIPITAITSASLTAKAILLGIDEVVFANEASANEPTLVVDGEPVNHQYSKSWEFEKIFGSTLKEMSVSVQYFSVIRPLSEMAVAKILSQMESEVLAKVSSCNRNFHIDGSKPDQQWCNNCAKCAFVFLALAPFIGKERVTSLFEGDMLDSPSQLHRFVELVGERSAASLECIGTAEESQWAVTKLVEAKEWHDSDTFNELVSKSTKPLPNYDPLLPSEAEHQVPPELMKAIKLCLTQDS